MICNNHDSIMKLANKISRLKPNDYENAESLFDDIKSDIDEIYSLAYEAKQMGQKMEDRLKDYRSSIEGLGFTRDNK